MIRCVLSAEEIAEKLQDRNLTVLSMRTGVGYPTLWRLKKYPEYGVNYETVKKISDYLEQNE